MERQSASVLTTKRGQGGFHRELSVAPFRSIPAESAQPGLAPPCPCTQGMGVRGENAWKPAKRCRRRLGLSLPIVACFSPATIPLVVWRHRVARRAPTTPRQLPISAFRLAAVGNPDR